MRAELSADRSDEPLMTPDVELLGRTIAEARRQAGISQRKAGEAIGRSAAYVHAIEAGRGRLERGEFRRLCAALNTDPGHVFDRYLEVLVEETERVRAGLHGLPPPAADGVAS